MSLAEEQIKSAFAQSEKEVQDLHTRISQGMRESKRNGKSIGLARVSFGKYNTPEDACEIANAIVNIMASISKRQ